MSSYLTILNVGSLRKEIETCMKQLRKNECAFTLIHKNMRLDALTMALIQEQIAVFKQRKWVARKSNVREVSFGKKIGYLVVMQPPDESLGALPICPFSAALGLLVNGLGYVVTDRKTLDYIIKEIGIEGATSNPIFTKVAN